MPEFVKIFRFAEIGWETVVECEECCNSPKGLGCHECDHRGWRHMTEDEEEVYYNGNYNKKRGQESRSH